MRLSYVNKDTGRLVGVPEEKSEVPSVGSEINLVMGTFKVESVTVTESFIEQDLTQNYGVIVYVTPVDESEFEIRSQEMRENREKAIPGSWWRHVKTGNHYVVVDHVLLESTLEPHVTYYSNPDILWCRPASEFFDGRFVKG